MIEKQYLGLTDPAQVINALCEQLKTAEQTLDYQRDSNQTLIGEAATLRDTVTQQAARIKELEANNAALAKNRDNAVDLAKRATDDCITALVGEPKFKVGDSVVNEDYGNGLIMSTRRIGSNREYYVDFKARYVLWMAETRLSPSDDPLS